MTFSRNDKLKAMAIVHVFETGKPLGDHAACVVLDDGAGISYGINQFTHRSGSLLAVVEKYLAGGGAVGRDVIAERLPILKRTTRTAIDKLSADAQFKKALKAAAVTREMREAQEEVAFEKYLEPALDECERLGFRSPLSLAVIYDSVVHGSWEKIRDQVRVTPSGVSVSAAQTAKAVTLTEKAWITEYVRRRDMWLASVARLKKTTYRSQFFLRRIAIGKWDLEMPLDVHGVRLMDAMFEKNSPVGPGPITTTRPPAHAGGTDNSPVGLGPITTTRPPAHAGGSDLNDQPKSSDGRVDKNTAPAVQVQPANCGEDGEKRSGGDEESCLDRLEAQVDQVAEKVDQVDRIVTTTATRTDRAKSLWTTVAGTFWQMLWAVGGFVAGVPREVWLVVAVIVGLLMLFYLYRQISLGKMREGRS